MSEIKRIEQSEYASYFGEGSLLPNVDLKPYEVDLVKIDIEYNPKNDIANWVQEYTVRKLQSIAAEQEDIWFIVTGCPDGSIKRAQNTVHGGFAHQKFKDSRNNIVFVVKFGFQHELNCPFSFIVEYETCGHEKENKVLFMDERVLYRNILFRYDRGSSMKTHRLEWSFSVINGAIKDAWPHSIRTSFDKYSVSFVKENLRKGEIVTPLINIECGSKIYSKLLSYMSSFVIGVIAGLSANFIYNLF